MGLLIVAVSIAVMACAIVVWVSLTLPQQRHSESVSAWYREDGTRREH